MKKVEYKNKDGAVFDSRLFVTPVEADAFAAKVPSGCTAVISDALDPKDVKASGIAKVAAKCNLTDDEAKALFGG